MAVRYKPDRYQTVIPYVIVDDVPACLEFVTAAFGGQEVERVVGPDGRVMHGEARIGDCVVMMGGARPPEHPAQPAMIYVYVEDCDAAYQRALAAGGTSVMEPADQFYGDRNAGVKDPCGVSWWMATHVEDVPPDELARRASEAHGKSTD